MKSPPILFQFMVWPHILSNISKWLQWITNSFIGCAHCRFRIRENHSRRNSHSSITIRHVFPPSPYTIDMNIWAISIVLPKPLQFPITIPSLKKKKQATKNKNQWYFFTPLKLQTNTKWYQLRTEWMHPWNLMRMAAHLDSRTNEWLAWATIYRMHRTKTSARISNSLPPTQRESDNNNKWKQKQNIRKSCVSAKWSRVQPTIYRSWNDRLVALQFDANGAKQQQLPICIRKPHRQRRR